MLQVKFLLVGLLLAAAFVAYQWLDDLPPIPPVQVPVASSAEGVPGEGANVQLSEPVRVGAEDNPVSNIGRGESAVGAAALGLDGADASMPAEVLPALNDSDGWLREKLASAAVPWIAETELVRTSATVLANAARGEVPRKFVEFLAPEGKFTVAFDEGRLTAAAASHARYSRFVGSLTSMDPAYAAQMFGLVEPLLAEALRELGGDATGSVASPRELAVAALGVALATPMSGATDATLVRPNVIYKYADNELEGLVPLQKQLLRMGPENLEKVRLWLEEFGVELASSER